MHEIQQIFSKSTEMFSSSLLLYSDRSVAAEATPLKQAISSQAISLNSFQTPESHG